MGAKNILVNLGGNMRCRGDGGGRDGWVLGIRNPFNRDAILGSVRLTDGMAVATSGHYERFVVMEGKKYAHIMDPRTGRPVVGMAGVTVIAPKAGDADVLSTTLFVLGPEEGQKLLTRFPGAHALFVPDEQPPRLIMSPGFGGYLTPPHDSAE
jgi:thiamine biosynthesis lipoprotein